MDPDENNFFDSTMDFSPVWVKEVIPHQNLVLMICYCLKEEGTF